MTTPFIVFRRGYHPANQQQHGRAPVYWIEAADVKSAIEAARAAGVHCHSNQYLSAALASTCSAEELIEAQDQANLVARA